MHPVPQLIAGLVIFVAALPSAAAGDEATPELLDPTGDSLAPGADLVAGWIEDHNETHLVLVMKLQALPLPLDRAINPDFVFTYRGWQYTAGVWIDYVDPYPWFYYQRWVPAMGCCEGREYNDTTGSVVFGSPGYVRVDVPKAFLDEPSRHEGQALDAYTDPPTFTDLEMFVWESYLYYFPLDEAADPGATYVLDPAPGPEEAAGPLAESSTPAPGGTGAIGTAIDAAEGGETPSVGAWLTILAGGAAASAAHRGPVPGRGEASEARTSVRKCAT